MSAIETRFRDELDMEIDDLVGQVNTILNNVRKESKLRVRPGVVSYVVSQLINMLYVKDQDIKTPDMVEVQGILTKVLNDFQREVANVHEDSKTKSNGRVFATKQPKKLMQPKMVKMQKFNW